MKFFPLFSNAVPSCIICVAEIVFIDPKQTNNTEFEGFVSSHSLQTLGFIPPTLPREPVDRTTGPIDQTGILNFLVK
ncbi:hypothetical protein MtrunA17_Chr2g0329121 [Medicago truncatula]|uniref:Uncharacterized protein n=1 Tax=Medicago truncatula TaxID=3880 RepID=A0A396JD78_MEDTR|nr:hypothetical protein MtrunA17_Chr2g0329121 [Medicago truncatula]